MGTAVKRAREIVRDLWTKLPAPLRGRSLRYWATALAVLVLVTWTQPFVMDHLNFAGERNWLFNHLVQSQTNPSYGAENVKVVLIGDDAFWTGDLHHRSPMDRHYLARLVRAADQAGASVIGLDVLLYTPTPAVPVKVGDYAAVDDVPDYRDETDDLIRSIDQVAQRTPVVLTKSIAGANGAYRLQSDVYEPYGLCTALIADGNWANPGTGSFQLTEAAKRNIACGYAALMADARRIPPPIAVAGQHGKLDAFAAAIVRLRRPQDVPANLGGVEYFGQYVGRDVSADPTTTISSQKLLTDSDAATRVLRGWPGIIGENWHAFGKGAGPLVDLHATPIGMISGTLIHANLAEALLSHHAYPGLGAGTLRLLEFMVGVTAAISLASLSSLRMKAVALVGATILLFTLQWLALPINWRIL